MIGKVIGDGTAIKVIENLCGCDGRMWGEKYMNNIPIHLFPMVNGIEGRASITMSYFVFLFFPKKINQMINLILFSARSDLLA